MKQCTRGEFLQVGLGLLAVAVGCGDDTGSGGNGGTAGTGAASNDGGAGGDGQGAGASNGGAPANGGGGSTPASGGGGAGAAMCLGAITALISDNTGHELIVPLADIEAAVEKTYDASGIASHCHEVTLTAEDFLTLQNGGTVIKKTCNGQTEHEFTLSCGNPPEPMPPDCSDTPDLGTCG